MQNDMDRTKIYTFERMIQVVVAQPIIWVCWQNKTIPLLGWKKIHLISLIPHRNIRREYFDDHNTRAAHRKQTEGTFLPNLN
jgi:hypothetical protein